MGTPSVPLSRAIAKVPAARKEGRLGAKEALDRMLVAAGPREQAVQARLTRLTRRGR